MISNFPLCPEFARKLSKVSRTISLYVENFLLISLSVDSIQNPGK